MTLEALRTPEHRFEALPDWPYLPHYLDDLPGFEGLRMHYVDEGPRDGSPTFLCLHGEPTWAYLFRRMIPELLGSGARVVAPDFFGFGRSDKPVLDEAYTWDLHRDSLEEFVRRLDLKDITLVVQDWGGLLGLTLPATMPERITGLLIMNTAFAVGVEPTEGFLAWRDFVAKTPDLDVGRVVASITPHLSADEQRAYDAPFPDASYKAGVRRFPQLVPTDPSMDGVTLSRAAQRWWASEFEGRSFMAIGMSDPVLGPTVMRRVRATIKGCPEPLELPDAGHFVQEWGGPVARAALDSWNS
jgi:haloalkane dehalogenase